MQVGRRAAISGALDDASQRAAATGGRAGARTWSSIDGELHDFA